MKNTFRYLLGGLLSVAFVALAQAAELKAGAFSASQARGDVTYKLAGSTEYLPLTSGTALAQGATIKTGANSTVSIVFASGATAMVRPNSEIEVTKFEQEAFTGAMPAREEPAVSDTQLRLLQGEVVSNVRKLKSTSKYVINTPVGAAGVRGTFFSASYDPSTGKLVVATLNGSVEVILPGATGGDIVDANEQLTINPNQAPIKIKLPKSVALYLSELLGESVKTITLTFPDLETSQIGVSIN